MGIKYYGVKVPSCSQDDFIYVTFEGGLPWYTDSFIEALLFAESWGNKSKVVELEDGDLE